MPTLKRLDATKDAALHQQLYVLLRERIASGVLAPGQRLPSERQLAAEHGISRTTIRQALRWLANDNLIYSRPGSGYYVASPSTEPHLRLLDSAEQMQADGLPYSTRVLQRQVVNADAALAQNLNLLEGDKVILLRVLQLVHDAPICIETMYLPFVLFPELLQEEVTSVHEALERCCEVDLSHGTQTVQAALASPEECDMLGALSPLAVLVIRRRTFDIYQKLIMYSVSVFRGERYPLRMTLRRD